MTNTTIARAVRTASHADTDEQVANTLRRGLAGFGYKITSKHISDEDLATYKRVRKHITNRYGNEEAYLSFVGE